MHLRRMLRRLAVLALLLPAVPALADLPPLPPAKPAQLQAAEIASEGPRAEAVQTASRPRADYILVDKTARSLQLFAEGREIASYPIQLGKQPVGHKRQEGDNRTPEGIYHIDWRNPESAFFLSLRISYPNEEDRERAAAGGVRPGNMIMIHGMPNNLEYRREIWDDPNWTNGCIALRDHHMAEVWELVDIGTPIEIRP